MAAASSDDLNRSECRVLAVLVDDPNLTGKEIASRLGLTRKTVENYLTDIRAKLAYWTDKRIGSTRALIGAVYELARDMPPDLPVDCPRLAEVLRGLGQALPLTQPGPKEERERAIPLQVGSCVRIELRGHSTGRYPDATWHDPGATLEAVGSAPTTSSVNVLLHLPDGKTELVPAHTLEVRIMPSRERVPVEFHNGWYVCHDPYWGSVKRSLVSTFISEWRGVVWDGRVVDIPAGPGGTKLVVTVQEFDDYLLRFYPNYKALEHIVDMHQEWYRELHNRHKAGWEAAAQEYDLVGKVARFAAERGWQIHGLAIAEDFLNSEAIVGALFKLVERFGEAKKHWDEKKEKRSPCR